MLLLPRKLISSYYLHRLVLTAQDADENPLTAIITPSAMKETISSPSLDSLYNARSMLSAWTAAGRGEREEEEEAEDAVWSGVEATERREVTVCFKHALLLVLGSVIKMACERTNHCSKISIQ